MNDSQDRELVSCGAVLLGLLMGLTLAGWMGSRVDQLPARYESDPTIDLTREP